MRRTLIAQLAGKPFKQRRIKQNYHKLQAGSKRYWVMLKTLADLRPKTRKATRTAARAMRKSLKRQGRRRRATRRRATLT